MNIFSEIYGAYFRIAAKLMENKSVSEKEIRKVILDEGFRDSILFLPQKLIPDGGDWGLFRRNESSLIERVTKKAPVKVLTKLEMRWLKSKLDDERIGLFLDEDALESLRKRLKDVIPLYTKEHFGITDVFSDRDSFTDKSYLSHFRAVLDAVKSRNIMDITFMTGHGRVLRGRYVLLKIEYSPKNDKFRVYCCLLKNNEICRSGIINIGRINSITDTNERFDKPVSLDDYFSSLRCSEPAVIRVTNERNGVERFMMEFASFEKHSVRDDEKGEYIIRLRYDRQDETELLIRLLSFGPVIEILAPKGLREQAKKRINNQYRLLMADTEQ